MQYQIQFPSKRKKWIPLTHTHTQREEREQVFRLAVEINEDLQDQQRWDNSRAVREGLRRCSNTPSDGFTERHKRLIYALNCTRWNWKYAHGNMSILPKHYKKVSTLAWGGFQAVVKGIFHKKAMETVYSRLT